MRVLMFGWEFPPHITGGLGTACYGMTKGLAKNGVEVLFVVPRAYGDEDESNVRLLNASDVTIDIDHEADRSYWTRFPCIAHAPNNFCRPHGRCRWSRRWH